MVELCTHLAIERARLVTSHLKLARLISIPTTEFLEPIDDRLFGRRASHRAVMKMNVDVASKMRIPEGRARNREGEGSMDSRNLTDAVIPLRRGGSDSTMTRTC
jgi:hypothetical protein